MQAIPHLPATAVALAFIAVGATLVITPDRVQQQTVQVDADDIGGTVTGPGGPEAGV